MPINEDVVWDDKPQLAPIISSKIDAIFGEDAPTALKVAKAESNLNPRAHNPKGGGLGAFGLYQIRGKLHEPVLKDAGIITDVNDLYDIDTNIKAAKFLKDKYGWEPWNESKKNWGKSAKTVNEDVVWDNQKAESVDEDVVWDTAKPSSVAPKVTATPPAQTEPVQDTELLDALEYGGKARLRSVKDMGRDIVSGAESVLSTGTGFAAMPLAGLAGVIGLVDAEPGKLFNPEKGEAMVQKVSDFFTYKPRLDPEKSQQISEAIQKPIELLDQGTGYVGEKVSDVTGSPLLGAGVKTALMMSVPAGIGKLAKVTMKGVASKIPDAVERKAFIADVAKEAKETGIPVDEVTQKRVTSILEGFDKETPPSRVVKRPKTEVDEPIINETPVTEQPMASTKVLDIKSEGLEAPKIEEAPRTEPHKTALKLESDAIAKKLIEDAGFGEDVAKYAPDIGMMKKQAEMAVKVMDADFPASVEMVLGERPLPEGVYPATMVKAVSARAEMMGDVDLVHKLGTDPRVYSPIMETARGLKAADVKNSNSPVDAIREISNARAETAKKTGRKPVDMGKLEADVEAKQTALDKYLEKKETASTVESGKYGTGNTVITNDAYLAAKAELKSKMGRMSSGVDPTAMADLAKIGAYHFEAGIRSFKMWSEMMIRDVGAWVKPHLADLWEQSKKIIHEGKKPEVALKSAKTRMRNETAALEEKISNQDFTKKERGKVVLDEEGLRLKSELDRAKRIHQAGAERSGTVTREETAKLMELSREVKRLEPPAGDMGTYPEHGAAIANFKNHVAELKGENAAVRTQLSDWASGVKTAWKQDPIGAVGGVIKDTIMQIRNNSVALVASCDMSALLRQGWHTLQTHPVIWLKGAKQSFVSAYKVMSGKDAHTATMADVYSRANYRNGSYDTAKLIPKHEEQFPTSLPGAVPGVGRVFRASEAAFTDFMVKIRVELYDLMAKQAKESGVVMDKAQIRDNGKMINALTARGDLGRLGESGIIKVALWAPRMLKGNWDVLTAHTFGMGLETSFARKQAAMNLVKVIGETATVLAIADALKPGCVEWDTTSPKFGKIKVGETYFDVTAGASSIVVLASRLGQGSYKNARGKRTTFSPQYGKQSGWDFVEGFITNKMPPSSRAVVNMLKGQNFKGENMTAGKALYELGTPITVQQTIDLNDKMSADRVAGVIADALGMNASQYDKRKRNK
jgi:hypothetical protein